MVHLHFCVIVFLFVPLFFYILVCRFFIVDFVKHFYCDIVPCFCHDGFMVCSSKVYLDLSLLSLFLKAYLHKADFFYDEVHQFFLFCVDFFKDFFLLKQTFFDFCH